MHATNRGRKQARKEIARMLVNLETEIQVSKRKKANETLTTK